MERRLTALSERFPIAGTFTISRGSKTEAEVVTCTVTEGTRAGRGECVPYRRYGETVEGVLAAIDAIAPRIAAGMTREELRRTMPAGAARNAVDCALWDLEAKVSATPAWRLVCAGAPIPLVTAYTLSLGDPQSMANQARANARRPLLKVKVGGDGDMERVRAVVSAAPQSRIVLDANEGWTEDTVLPLLEECARIGVALVEQPLPAGRDDALASFPHPVPVCADESVHTSEDLEALAGLYDAVNIKLDKAGGLTEAIRMREKARALGLSVMVGCMVGTSLAMAPAVLLAQDADYVDLDGPLLLARDREPGLDYEGSMVLPPRPDLWG
ncbi:MAG TPA: dipeptide epimerase [Rhizobiales bacterium]|nr:dipeptide epimerase [Hyphomicrobiales bacterium]